MGAKAGSGSESKSGERQVSEASESGANQERILYNIYFYIF